LEGISKIVKELEKKFRKMKSKLQKPMAQLKA